MTPSARIQAVLDLLQEIDTVPRPADAIASAYFRSRRYIGSHDRSVVSSMLYSILRHQARLGWWVQGNEEQNTPRTRLIAWLTLQHKKTLRDMREVFNGEKFSPMKLTEYEVALIEKLHGHDVEHPKMGEEIKAECPPWAAVSLKERFGDSFTNEMQALLQPAPLDLRVNPLKATRENMLDELKKAGVKAEPCPLSEFGIRVFERPSLAALPMLKDGSVEIQDEGSQLVAAMVDAKPGMRVMDFCAGAGGKTLAIAAQMQNKGRVIACDVLEKRLKSSTERFRRAGLHNIETRALSSERDAWLKKQQKSFDRVLIDVPCTGVGAWRRNPDTRWRELGPRLPELLKTQADILESAARLVKVDGKLIYATCSMLPEENEQQVEAFLSSHPEFQLMNVSEVLNSVSAKQDRSSSSPLVGEGIPPALTNKYLSLTPAQHNTDGFFGAIMKRVS